MTPATDVEVAAVTVLLVDDEPLVRMLIADALREAGARVVEAANGAEALAFLSSGQSVDLLLSDIQMPGGPSGMDLATHVRSHHPAMKVILISAAPPIGAADRADVLLPKPFPIETGVRSVFEILGATMRPGHF